jgi:hypothetical protein
VNTPLPASAVSVSVQRPSTIAPSPSDCTASILKTSVPIVALSSPYFSLYLA